jgi:hypothetical protein
LYIRLSINARHTEKKTAVRDMARIEIRFLDEDIAIMLHCERTRSAHTMSPQINIDPLYSRMSMTFAGSKYIQKKVSRIIQRVYPDRTSKKDFLLLKFICSIGCCLI